MPRRFKATDIVIFEADPCLYGPMEVQCSTTTWQGSRHVISVKAAPFWEESAGAGLVRVLGQVELFKPEELILQDEWLKREEAA